MLDGPVPLGHTLPLQQTDAHLQLQAYPLCVTPDPGWGAKPSSARGRQGLCPLEVISGWPVPTSEGLPYLQVLASGRCSGCPGPQVWAHTHQSQGLRCEAWVLGPSVPRHVPPGPCRSQRHQSVEWGHLCLGYSGMSVLIVQVHLGVHLRCCIQSTDSLQ